MKAYCRGEYGKTPAPIDPEIQEKILGSQKPIVGRFADTLPKDTYETAVRALGNHARSEEDVLSYILFPQVAERFFVRREAREARVTRYSIERVD